jgi:hypothetical protein
MADIIESGEHLGIKWQVEKICYGYFHYIFTNIKVPKSNFRMSGRYEALYFLDKEPSSQHCIDEIERIVSLYEQGGQKYLNAKQQIEKLIQPT